METELTVSLYALLISLIVIPYSLGKPIEWKHHLALVESRLCSSEISSLLARETN